MTEHADSPPATTDPTPARRSFNPLRWLLNLFTSVRFGVVLMVLIFIYCTIGSAGILYPATVNGKFVILHDFIRKWRPFEMTEYEWFNTPLFIALIALLCTNMMVVTIRRIRLNAVNLGVWMIHIGIVTLALASVWYFTAKVEGDTPVFRWRIVAEVPGHPPQSFAALSNNAHEFSTPEGDYSFRIAMMDPNWPIISPGFEGQSAYAITVVCTTPRGTFMRQLLDGYPQFTQDLITSPEGPKRVKTLPEFEGRSLFDEQLKLTLVPDPQQHFWVKDSAVLSIRQVVNDIPGQWHERPLPKLPRYNDYIANTQDVWRPTELFTNWNPTPLSFTVPPADDTDPLTGTPVRITAHLRYAQMQSQFIPGGGSEPNNPVAELTLAAGNSSQSIRLIANDESQRSALRGLIELRRVDSVAQVRDLSNRETQRLVVTIPAGGQTVELNLDELQTQPAPDFVAIGDSGYAVRFRQVLDHRPQSPDIGALIDIRTPDRVFSRWVPMRDSASTAAPAPPQDFILEPGADMPKKVDPTTEVVTEFDAGIPPLTLVAGPGEVGLRVIGRMIDLPEGLALHTGASVKVQDALNLTINRYIPDAQIQTKPLVVPLQARDKNIDESRAATMVRVELDDAGSTQTQWIVFDRYLLDDPAQQRLISGTPPARFTLADGRVFDIAVSRKRMELPAPVILKDFELLTHVGGYSGTAASVRDWVSQIEFQPDDGEPAQRDVSVNNPKPFGEYWYFQSYWDAPTAQRPGQTFTGLGVGNRHGVQLQLFGSAVSVVGMIYAFYFKPIIKRRRADKVRAAVARGEYGEQAKDRLEHGAPATQSGAAS